MRKLESGDQLLEKESNQAYAILDQLACLRSLHLAILLGGDSHSGFILEK
jgi:hypothetical protein